MGKQLLLGCIADDFTGTTDLANTLVKEGMRTVQVIGVPGQDFPCPDSDAVVIALKSRTAPVQEAIEESVAALNWLQSNGAEQFFFKYCSTFDSTDQGNIGPVAEALLAELDDSFTIACPAFPANGRSIYQGYLFVGDRLLSESSMKDHPLTPMGDPDLVRVLGRQARAPVGLISWSEVSRGSQAAGELIETAMATLATGLVAMGVEQLIVAGGETSGAVVKKLGIQAMEIGVEIEPGVPWCMTLGKTKLRLALKSGNFGGDDFFEKALDVLKWMKTEQETRWCGWQNPCSTAALPLVHRETSA
ncbi:MAG: four-carbon acid sugar kinase family protein [Gammaproteobacteria bacterium]|nr:four-carbon acid sugar kinase family protein [Gammaproteobacteria bacterium]